MRQLLLATLFLCTGIAGAQAAATNTAFPPDNCTAESPFMAFNGTDTNQNTYCSNGQFIFNNALPNCSEGQVVAKVGGAFICKDNNPTPGTCPEGQALTYTTAGFQCMTVPVDYNVQACAAPNFLTYNPGNKTFVCSSPAAINLSCPSGQVLQGIVNSQAVCAAAPSSTLKDCVYSRWVYHYQWYSDQFNFAQWWMDNDDHPQARSYSSLTTALSHQSFTAHTGDLVDLPAEDGDGSSGIGANYMCVNGNWANLTQYSPPATPSPGGGDGGGDGDGGGGE